MGEIEIKPDVKNKIPNKNEVVVRLLNATSDEEFRKNLPLLKENVPPSVLVIDEQHTGNEPEKFEHTFKTLNLLNTEGLNQEDKFIARAGMLMHDCLPENAINDLCEWQKQGLIDFKQAYKISQQIWWHDFLGNEDINKRKYSVNIFEVIKDVNDRNINRRIFEADITSYGFQNQYKEMLENLDKYELKKSTILDIDGVEEKELLDKEKYRAPTDEEVFVHAIFTKHNEDIKDLSKNILQNIISQGALKSQRLVTMLERNKVGIELTTHMSNSELNVSRFDMKNNSISKEQYNSDNLSMCSFVMLGKENKEEFLVTPLGGRNEISDTAGVVNKFDNEGVHMGAEVDGKNIYFFISKEGAINLGSILKMEAFREGVDPNIFVNERVVVYDNNINELVKALYENSLDIKLNNAETIMNSLNYEGSIYEKKVIDSGLINCIDESATCWSYRNNYYYEIIKTKLQKYTEVFPWLSSTEWYKNIDEKLTRDELAKNIFFQKSYKNGGYYYDEDKHQLSIATPANFDCLTFINVKNFERKLNDENRWDDGSSWKISTFDNKEISFDVNSKDFI